ncbi:MAG TPA: tetratricopeptide repeat protein [Psychromonas hadalis]|nr:tetratricopeptide repeat protein [Psychromonas hadalis]
MVDIIEGYETEEQQIDAIKSWWKENGTMLIVGAVVGLVGLWGYRYYNESILTGQEEASQGYSNILVKAETQGIDSVKDDMQKFAQENTKNSYGVLASLLLAKEAVVQKDFKLAESQLTQLQTQNSYAPLTPVINLRLGRVQAQLGENDKALATLDAITETAFIVKKEQAKGLIYLALADNKKALDAFQKAISASKGRVDPVLQMQFDDLTVVGDALSAPAPVLDK